MTKVLIYYLHFTRVIGGGEFIPLAFISELQKTCEVTLALDWANQEHLENAIRQFGISIDLSRLKIERVTPEGYHPSLKTTCFTSFYRYRRLKALAKNADICISMVNVMDFGRPAHHFIYSVDMGDDDFAAFVANGQTSKKKRGLLGTIKRFVANSLIRPLLGMHARGDVIRDPKGNIYPNSYYTERLLRDYYGDFNSTVFYPPTLFACNPKESQRDPLLVLYIGRIVKTKRIEDMIDIVRRARDISGKNLKLHFAGSFQSPTSPFAKEMHSIEEKESWVSFVGPRYDTDKTAFLLSGTYALHAERDEAFGISVTEYLKAGLVPVVPDEGGTTEIVNNPALSFHTNEEAAQILVRLLQDETFRTAQQRACAERAKLFTREAYLKKQHLLLEKILAEAQEQQQAGGHGQA